MFDHHCLLFVYDLNNKNALNNLNSSHSYYSFIQNVPDHHILQSLIHIYFMITKNNKHNSAIYYQFETPFKLVINLTLILETLYMQKYTYPWKYPPFYSSFT